MKNIFQINIVKLTALLLGLNLIFNLPVKAEKTLQIDYENTGFQNQELREDKIKILVNYKPFNYETDDWENNNLTYQIYYDNQLKIEDGKLTINFAEVSLKDLDNDKIPEIIVQTFSGGAHCCTNNIIYLWRENTQEFKQIETGELDGGGGIFKDLNQDGKYEFVSVDNSFFYAFAPYAASFPPSLILTIENGDFKDVTTQYPEYLRSIAWEMFKIIKENEYNNGVLASYVAQKILLGEYEDGWKFMLANYNKELDWGLTIYDDNGNNIGNYPDFPTALKAFLIKTGYLDKQGKPIK